MRTAAAWLSACVAACSIWNPLAPDIRTPADRAHELMPKCSNEVSTDALDPSHIEEVKPLYTTVPTGNDRIQRMRGAEIHLHPIANLSAEGIQRKLECHEARVVAGRDEPLADDPYVLDGAWLDVKVRADGDEFVVAVQTDVLEQAKAVFERALRFRAHPPGGEPKAPPPTAARAP